MKRQKNIGVEVLQVVIGIMIVAAFLFFVIGEMVMPAENFKEIGEQRLYSGEWKQVLPDGTRQETQVPGECEVAKGDWATIETVLPVEQEDTCFCVRSLQHDFKIYVGDELRKEYSTIDTQLFGKTSTIAYVFWEVGKEDAGKTLRIEYMSDSSYSGYMSEVYEGDRIAMWRYLIATYAPSTMVAVFLLFVGLVVVVLSLLFRLFYKKEVELLHLGNAIMIASAWMIAESRLRQFILPNSTIAVYLGFFMIMLLPAPFAIYINKIQKCRYQKAYSVLLGAVVINSVFATTLQILRIKDFFETMTISHVIIFALILVMAITIILDIRGGYLAEYKEVAIGLAGLMAMGLGELGMVYSVNSQYNGIPLCMGMVFLLGMAAMKARKDILLADKEREIAIAASESKAQFLASMSHEIRTPINTIVGMNEMILRENEDDTTREYAYNIKSASEMLLGLINDILDISKIEAGKLQIVESEYSLVSMVKSVVLGIQVRAQEKELEMKLEIEENLPSVLKGDEIRIKQILNNLLSNAVKYTATGSVTLIAKGVQKEDGFFLHLAVKDTGMGIGEEDLKQIFEKFLRVDLKKNRNVEGTGLGLSITKQLTENMGGTITVTSEKGKGSCFTVEIPQEIIDKTEIGKFDLKTKIPQIVKTESKEQWLYAPEAKVLVVDDNDLNLKVIAGLLKRSEIQLDFATGGTQCLEMSREKKYDLILMDHMMPEPDGVETLHMLKAQTDNPNQGTPVIVLTANSAENEEGYLKEGFVDYLSKPIQVEKIETTLAKYL